MGLLLNLFMFTRFLFSLLLFYFITTRGSSMQPRCHYDEQSALLQFKESFTFNKSASVDASAYPKVVSWKLEEGSGDCCTWDGVECDEGTGHVIGLDLSNSCLYGSININSSLFHLDHLQRLDLSYNNFNLSQMPSGIGHLSKLTYLNLSSSLFSGQIPSEISQLSSLSSLDLSYNDELELREPNLGTLVENLTSLEKIDLSSVHISSIVPDTLANLSSLPSLVLESCGLHGEFPESIFRLPNLQFLNVEWNNNLTGYLPEFQRTSSLKSLRLRNTSFSGQIPSSIGNLASLNNLDIQDCNFSGLVPSSLGNLTQLTFLNLARNQLWSQNYSSFSWLDKLTKLTTLVLHGIDLNGEIPFSLANLTQLSYLDLSSTQLIGQIPSWLMNLTQLSILDLGSNKLDGHIPYWLMNLTQLTQLDLSFNKLEGPIPGSIFELKNLQQLRLHSNSLNGTMEVNMFFKLRSLTLLLLSSNKLSLLSKNDSNIAHQSLKVLGLASCNLHEFPHFLQSQYALWWLDLSSNSIHGQVPKWLSNLRSLQFVKFSHNFLTGFEQHPVILPWTRPLTIDLRSNMLQGSLPIPPASINFYFFSKNKLTGGIPPLICNLSSLHALDLSLNNLTDMLPQCLGNFSASLSILNLRGNNFHGTIPQSWTTGSKLRMIDLSHNKFHGRLPRSLGNCRMLQFLNFGYNQINDIFPYWLGSLPELRVLILRYNEFNGVMGKPGSTFEFPKLCIIDLSHNSFIGKLPSEYFQYLKAMKVVGGQRTYLQESLIPENGSLYASFGNYAYTMTLNNKGIELAYPKILDVLTAIDLSSNQFEGNIPETIGNLEGLHVLNLSNNFFTGDIPSSLGNITALESLDLSQNRLTGGIPQQLAQLNYLAVFNVSYNHLTGPILQGKQFNTFLNNSYEGNSGLCGDPLSKRCGTSDASPEQPSGFKEEQKLDWKMVLMGYSCGFVIGVAIGHTVTTQKRGWFMMTFGRLQQKRQRRRGHN